MRSVLIADDDPETRELLAALLEEEGFTAELARNGREALALLRTVAFRAAVVDLLMPVMNGWELVQVVRADPSLRRTPLIVTTALTHVGAPECFRFLRKPFAFEDLLNAILEARTAQPMSGVYSVIPAPDQKAIPLRGA